MPLPPHFDIDPAAFWRDPYPDLARMRAHAPVAIVPQLNATLLCKRDDIFTCEKNVEVFSSYQPGGLMTTLMGENLMRKDGSAHQVERKQLFPSLSPVTVRDHWRGRFEHHARAVLAELPAAGSMDLVRDYAMPVSANALREITGLISMSPDQMDACSQGMIDGCANYAGDAAIEARCHAATTAIDVAIDTGLAAGISDTDFSMLSVLTRAGQPLTSVRANIKLAISGGQNEPRDAIAGATWALLGHPDQLERVRNGSVSWLAAFEEYARWISPIGMSPRRVARDFLWRDVDLQAESRVFLMFGSANRDEDVFDRADEFDVTRNTSKAVSFGAGPHFCAGAAASRSLIAEVALPRLFDILPKLRINGDVPFGGWAFRGPVSMPVAWG
jgi:cytochrome P450